jgi:hypothetical protein
MTDDEGLTAKTTASHVEAVLSMNLALYVPGTIAGPVSAARKFEEASGCAVKVLSGAKVSATEPLAKPINRSLLFVVVILGLVT